MSLVFVDSARHSYRYQCWKISTHFKVKRLTLSLLDDNDFDCDDYVKWNIKRSSLLMWPMEDEPDI